ncbi:Uncharacterised protein [Fusobacterium periodonticum]|nr:Uncharacterised protein [Fusobacterium periodonticum]
MSPIAIPACTAVALLPIATPEPDNNSAPTKTLPFESFVGPGTTLAPSPKEIALATFVEALGPIAIALFAVAPSFNLFPASLEFIETYLNLLISVFNLLISLPNFLATENNCEPLIASVLVAEISPGATFFN